uniref:hypothetical protein n=2 Tax=Campylobacter mucosalis TaxID=202 RepID=UPI00146FEC6D
MKFSKIACVALLSASISTVALAQQAQPQQVRKTKLELLEEIKKDEVTRTAGYNTIVEAINELRTIGYDKLKTWSGDKSNTDTDINTKIYSALEKIQKATADIKNKDKKLKVTKESSTLTITQQGEIKILIKGDGNTAVNGGNDQELALSLETFKADNKEKIKDIFAEDNKDVWEAFIKDFTAQHNVEQKVRLKAIDRAALKVVQDTPADQVINPNDRYLLFIENKSLVENAAKASMKDGQAALIEARAAVDKAIKEVSEDKLTLLSKDNAGIIKQETTVNALIKTLEEAKKKNSNNEAAVKAKADALIAAIDAGVKLQTKANNGRALTKEDINGIKNGTANKDDFDNGGADNTTSDENKAKILDSLIGNNQNSGAQKAVKEANQVIEKVIDKIEKVTEAETVIKEANKVIAKYASESAKATS